MPGSSAVLLPRKTHSTSLERSKPPLLTQTLSKSLGALLVYFISVQSTLISIGVPFSLDLSVSGYPSYAIMKRQIKDYQKKSR